MFSRSVTFSASPDLALSVCLTMISTGFDSRTAAVPTRPSVLTGGPQTPWLRQSAALVSRGAGRHPSVGAVSAPHRSCRRWQCGSTACAIQQRACGSRVVLRRRPVRSSDWPRRVRSHAGLHAGIPRPDRHPTAQSCNPRSVPGRRVRREKVRTSHYLSRAPPSRPPSRREIPPRFVRTHSSAARAAGIEMQSTLTGLAGLR